MLGGPIVCVRIWDAKPDHYQIRDSSAVRQLAAVDVARHLADAIQARCQHSSKLIIIIIRLDALALSVIATATWLAGWLGGCHTPVLYQNR